MLIVDAQIHLWASPTGPAHHRRAPLGADEAIRMMDAAGVDRAVNCPAIWDPQANEIAIAAATRYPNRIATMGWFKLAPTGNGDALSQWKRQPGMLGLRFVIANSEQLSWLASGQLDWLWRAAERYDIPVGLAAPGGLPHIGKVAERHPQLRLLIDHMGAGHAGKVPDVFNHFPELMRLAVLPNVAVKATAAPGYATDPYPFRSVHGYLKTLFESFGPDRTFWGTDITRMPCSWRECVTMFAEELPWLTGRDKEMVMGRALCQWIGWPISDVGVQTANNQFARRH